MIKSLLWLLIGCFLFSGCASTRITSFTDPDYKSFQFKKILIVGNTNKLDDRLNLENRLTEVFTANGVEAVSSYSIFPPTRQFSDSTKVEIMLANEFDGCLMITFGERGIQQVQIPVTGSRTKGKVNKIGDKITYEEKTTYIGGQVLDKPYAEFEMKLYDVVNGSMAWIAESFTGGNAYASFNTVYNSFCNKIVKELAFDNLIRVARTDKESSLIDEIIKEKIERIDKEIKENPESTIIAVVILNDGSTIEGKILDVEHDYGDTLKLVIEDNYVTYKLIVKDIKELHLK